MATREFFAPCSLCDAMAVQTGDGPWVHVLRHTTSHTPVVVPADVVTFRFRARRRG